MNPLILQATGCCESHLRAINEKIKVHQDALSAWQQLILCANADGINLTIASSFRSFSRQLAIWNGKFSGAIAVKNDVNQTVDLTQASELEKIHAILRFSALPGASRHHWGTDFDVYDPSQLNHGQTLQLEPWEYEPNGPFFKLSQWLNDNLSSLDFAQPYNRDVGGIAIEPWHISFTPVASTYEHTLTQHVLHHCLAQSDILGKMTILANLPELFERYVQNKGLQHVN